MTIHKTILEALPVQEWKVAKIIRFRFRYHLCDCDGTVVYTRPFTTTYNKDTPDIIDNCILEAIKGQYSDIQTYSKHLIWNNDYSDIQKIYDGGRPKTRLTIRMSPSFDADMLPKLVGRTIYAYDVYLNIFLNYIGDDIKHIPSDIFTTQGFPYEQDKLFSTITSQISSL